MALESTTPLSTNLGLSILSELPQEPMNGQELATEFEQVKMIDSVRRTNDLDQLKIITIKLIETNFGMREQFKRMIHKDWLTGNGQ